MLAWINSTKAIQEMRSDFSSIRTIGMTKIFLHVIVKCIELGLIKHARRREQY